MKIRENKTKQKSIHTIVCIDFITYLPVDQYNGIGIKEDQNV